MAAAGPSAEKPAAQAPGTKQEKVAPALEVAAELGVLEAQLKLARMHESGDGAPLSPKKAFELYQKIIEDHADVRPNSPRAAGVAKALIALGNFYRTGIPGAFSADPQRGVRLLHYAASYYGDPDAQCHLALMYLDGEGVPKSAHLAVNWLTNAAKKRHARAQALLGDLLWRGVEGVPRQAAKGLALLSLARQNAKSEEEARWVETLYAGAYREIQSEERERAADLALQWQPRMGREGVVIGAPKVEAAPAAAAADGSRGQSVKGSGVTNVGMEGQAATR